MRKLRGRGLGGRWVDIVVPWTQAETGSNYSPHLRWGRERGQDLSAHGVASCLYIPRPAPTTETEVCPTTTATQALASASAFAQFIVLRSESFYYPPPLTKPGGTKVAEFLKQKQKGQKPPRTAWGATKIKTRPPLHLTYLTTSPFKQTQTSTS
jgi:hypothetical protein